MISNTPAMGSEVAPGRTSPWLLLLVSVTPDSASFLLLVTLIQVQIVEFSVQWVIQAVLIVSRRASLQGCDAAIKVCVLPKWRKPIR